MQCAFRTCAGPVDPMEADDTEAAIGADSVSAHGVVERAAVQTAGTLIHIYGQNTGVTLRSPHNHNKYFNMFGIFWCVLDGHCFNWYITFGALCAIHHCFNWYITFGALCAIHHCFNWYITFGTLCAIHHCFNWHITFGALCAIQHFITCVFLFSFQPKLWSGIFYHL